MKIIALLTVVLLAGCSAVPVARHFPEVPDELKVACTDLGEVNPATDKLSDVVSVVTDNYSKYHECRIKVDTWNEWYKSQKEIFDSVK